MSGSNYGANPETANRILEVIREKVDKHGFWEARSLSQTIVKEVKLSEKTVQHYLRVLKSLGFIAMTKVKRREQLGWEKVDRMKLLRPNHVVVKDGRRFMAIEP